ncbi:MAG: acyl-CoA dehydratase activase [Bacillota bacterium]|nr:acyl-CoA dehydratase activase [Bacillota bacterium]
MVEARDNGAARVCLGVDVGSVTTKLALLTADGEVSDSLYMRTDGHPIRAIQEGLRQIGGRVPPETVVYGAGATGSGRQLAGVMIGADVVKNEITAHAVAALKIAPGARTVIEIGGQDSKIIIIRDGVVVDFAMNTVCAAGTGSFLDHQAARLKIPIEEFGEIALRSKRPVRIAGRCGVFAESDMIHKQQAGYATEDIIAGLCEALVRNYLNNVARGKQILGPIIFQGGVAANVGIRAALERALGEQVIVPPHYGVTGAIGAAMLAQEAVAPSNASGCSGGNGGTRFRGFEVGKLDFRTSAFECSGCPNICEVVEVRSEGKVLARWGDRCGKWSMGVA